MMKIKVGNICILHITLGVLLGILSSCDSSVKEIGKGDVVNILDYVSSGDSMSDATFQENDVSMDHIEDNDYDVSLDSFYNEEDIVDLTSDSMLIKDILINDGGVSCITPCNCPSGEVCENGRCVSWRDAIDVVFCCTDPQCVEGYDCIMPDGRGFAKCKTVNLDAQSYIDTPLIDEGVINDVEGNDSGNIRDSGVIIYDTGDNQDLSLIHI
ncbi:MAG: hypothetical protein N2746_01915, partial [Deltaproteobacteria bacterium]|nr:hypothetical protein [Deltaproteobacteria bacterium]